MRTLTIALIGLACLRHGIASDSGESGTTVTVTTPESEYAITLRPEEKKEESVTYYSILSKASGFAVAVSMGSGNDGSHVIEWKSKRGFEQQWRMQPAGEGWFSLRARHSNKALSIRAGSKEPGEDAIQWKAGEDHGQEWRLVFDEDGFARIQNRGSELYLSVRARGGTHGDLLAQKEYEDSDDQKWSLQIADRVEPE